MDELPNDGIERRPREGCLVIVIGALLFYVGLCVLVSVICRLVR